MASYVMLNRLARRSGAGSMLPGAAYGGDGGAGGGAAGSFAGRRGSRARRDGAHAQSPRREGAVAGTAFADYGQQNTPYLPAFDKAQRRHRLSGSACERLVRSRWVAGCVSGTAPTALTRLQPHPVVDWGVNALLRGAGQVCFMNNPTTGLLFVIGLALNAPAAYTILGVLGLVVSCAAAALLRLEWRSIQSGLYGYNGLLVGYAMAVLFSDTTDGTKFWLVVVAVIVTSLFATLLNVALGNAFVGLFKLPPLTLPFNIATLAFFLAVGSSSNFVFTGAGLPRFPDYATRVDGDPAEYSDGYDQRYFSDGGDVVKAGLRGLSQVFLSDDPLAGGFIVAGLAVCSPISALFGVVGSVVGLLTAVFMGANKAAIITGLWSYNAVLSSIAVGGMFFVLTWQSALLAVLAALLTTVIHGAVATLFLPFALPPLTLPFCLATALFILIQKSLPGFTPVALDTMTVPEEHLYRLRTAKGLQTAVVEEWRDTRARYRSAFLTLARARRGFVLLDPAAETRHSVSRDLIVSLLGVSGYPVSTTACRTLVDAVAAGDGMVPFVSVVRQPSSGPGPNIIIQSLLHTLVMHEELHPGDVVLASRRSKATTLSRVTATGAGVGAATAGTDGPVAVQPGGSRATPPRRVLQPPPQHPNTVVQNIV